MGEAHQESRLGDRSRDGAQWKGNPATISHDVPCPAAQLVRRPPEVHMTQPATAREEAQRRFKAAWNDSQSGGSPPDLDAFLAPFEEPERSAVRAELLELDQLFRRRSSD